jgi:hypothetical protein
MKMEIEVNWRVIAGASGSIVRLPRGERVYDPIVIIRCLGHCVELPEYEKSVFFNVPPREGVDLANSG